MDGKRRPFRLFGYDTIKDDDVCVGGLKEPPMSRVMAHDNRQIYLGQISEQLSNY
jgi:hypothetical protein